MNADGGTWGVVGTADAVVLPSTTECDARVRIFTPAAELPFAGHPVLGSAIVIGSALGRAEVTLQTGLMKATEPDRRRSLC